MEVVKEAYIKDSIEPLTLKSIEKIAMQMKKCVCKIHKGVIKGTGFFIKIPYNKSYLNLLITNNHILGKSDIANGKNIFISLNNELISKNIKITPDKNTYTNKILDITIIEINEEKDQIEDFLSLDNQIINRLYNQKEENITCFNDIYQNESIYIKKKEKKIK